MTLIEALEAAQSAGCTHAHDQYGYHARTITSYLRYERRHAGDEYANTATDWQVDVWTDSVDNTIRAHVHPSGEWQRWANDYVCF